MSADWRTLYPFASHHLTVDGHRYHYLDEGAGEVLLCVHGNPTWSFYWRNLILALRGRYRIVVPDHLGCGLSDKPRGYPYCLERHIENLRTLIDRLKLQHVTLVGHDWGGAIGMGAAATMPDNFSRIVLMNTGAFRSTLMPWRIRLCRIPVLGRLAVQGGNAFARAALSMATEKPERLTPPVKAGLLAPYDSWSNRRAIFEFVKDIPLSPRHPSYGALLRVEQGLAAFSKHPVLLIWGMRDWCFSPAFLQRFIEFFPQAEVREIDDAGHYVVEDAHERIENYVTDFLSRHPILDSSGVSSAFH